MAAYYGPDGTECDAVQLEHPQILRSPNGVIPVHAGDWILTTKDGTKQVCAAAEFVAWRQKYPKPVDGERIDGPRPPEKRVA
jgi:hypothetical protein